MGYQILRFEKIKSRQALEGRCKHATRERHPKNADLAKKDQNELDSSTAATLKAFDSRLAEIPKIRKDAVRAVEILVAFSPQEATRLSREQQDAYFKEARQWFAKHFGGEKNFLNCTIHRDETTSAHMTLFVMPIETIIDKKTGLDREQLNCKHWLGSPAKLSAWQTHFHDQVAVHYGLERGILGSKAHHQEVSRHYGLVKAAVEDSSLPPLDIPKHRVLMDPNVEIAEAVVQRDTQLQSKIEILAAQAHDADCVRKENQALKRTIARKDKQIEQLQVEISRLQSWIQKAKDIMIEGGARLMELVRGFLKERERPLTINSHGVFERGREMIEAARKGGAAEVKEAWIFFQAVKKASLPDIKTAVEKAYDRELNLREAEYLFDHDPSLAKRLGPFRDQHALLVAIASEKGLTVEGKQRKVVEQGRGKGSLERP